MNDFTVIDSNDIKLLRDRYMYLIDHVQSAVNAIDNELPDEALWELRRLSAAIDEWQKQ